MISVREAHQGDVRWLVRQMQHCDEWFGGARRLYPGDAYATDRVRQWVTDGPVFVAERTMTHPRVTFRHRIGFLIGMVHPHLFNPTIQVATSLFWWVVPSERGSLAGARLVRAFEDYAALHADWCILTLSHRSDVADRVLTKHGFERLETSYVKVA